MSKKKRFISLLLVFTMIFSLVFPSLAFASFSDIEGTEYEEAVEDASILDAVEEEPVAEITLDEVASDLDELVEEIEEEAAAEEARNYHPAYKYVRDKIIEKTPVTEEQMDKAEKIGKVALPVAAAATVVLMAAKLVQYRKQEIRRRTFFDWLG
jgi:hypothetical protein